MAGLVVVAGAVGVAGFMDDVMPVNALSSELRSIALMQRIKEGIRLCLKEVCVRETPSISSSSYLVLRLTGDGKACFEIIIIRICSSS
jgi:hypothetical protein